MKALIFSAFLIIFSCSSSKENEQFLKEIDTHRHAYKEDFITNPRSPLIQEDLLFLDFFPAKEKFKCQCSMDLTPQAKPFEMNTYSGDTQPYRKYGTITCKIGKDQVVLSAYENLRMASIPQYKNRLFLPFKDLTNGESTYGGGRYIDFEKKDIIDSVVLIDFNHAYNPWCAYSDGFNCPIPPFENHLNLDILSGEKAYKGEVKKS